MRMWFASLVLAIILAGCFGSDPTPAATTTSTSQCAGGCADAADPTPVAIDETVELTTSLDKVWRWNVSSGYTAFSVRLEGTGPGGAGNYVLQDFEYRLTGPAGDTGGKASGGFASSSGTMINHDGSGAGDAGPWEMVLRSGAGSGTFRATVTVTY